MPSCQGPISKNVFGLQFNRIGFDQTIIHVLICLYVLKLPNPLEADRLLLRRLHNRQEGRRNFWHFPDETKPPQQEGPGL